MEWETVNTNTRVVVILFIDVQKSHLSCTAFIVYHMKMFSTVCQARDDETEEDVDTVHISTMDIIIGRPMLLFTQVFNVQ